MGVAEKNLLIDDRTSGRFGTAGFERVAPQPMKEVKLTSTNSWQYFYLEPVLGASKSDTALRGGPLALLSVESNAVILDFSLHPEGSASLSDRSVAVGDVGAIPIFVARVAYKSAVAGAHGVIRFYAPYTDTALESM